jgi:hypothetical protein
MCSQHSQHVSQHHDPTADMFPDSNRVAKKVSDASVRIGRPGASSHDFSKASFVSTGSIPIGMDKYNKKIMIVTIRDPDLFRVEN